MLLSEMLADLGRTREKGNAIYVMAAYEHLSMRVNREVEP
jgi:O-acetylhomoserine/O-acetylserine sulfhydrylase-like pyridoxal-dependent enzyme